MNLFLYSACGGPSVSGPSESGPSEYGPSKSHLLCLVFLDLEFPHLVFLDLVLSHLVFVDLVLPHLVFLHPGPSACGLPSPGDSVPNSLESGPFSSCPKLGLLCSILIEKRY